jgi:hypothetical protein
VITPAQLVARILAPVVREIIRECAQPASQPGLPGTTASQVELGNDGVRVEYGFGVAKADTGVPRAGG